jgi:hypothetical protein
MNQEPMLDRKFARRDDSAAQVRDLVVSITIDLENSNGPAMMSRIQTTVEGPIRASRKINLINDIGNSNDKCIFKPVPEWNPTGYMPASSFPGFLFHYNHAPQSGLFSEFRNCLVC